MVVILKQAFPFVLAALLLVASLQESDAAARGIRGKQLEQVNPLAVSKDSNIDSVERELKKKKDKKKKKMDASSPVTGAVTVPESRFDNPAPTGPTLSTWTNGCSNEVDTVNSCASNIAESTKCKGCLYVLSFTSATPIDDENGVNACARDYCESCTKDDLMPFFKCGYEIKDKKKKEMDASNPVNGAVDAPESRFDIPALAPAPTGLTLSTWTNSCSNEVDTINSCASNIAKSTNCRGCLYALSFTSANPIYDKNGVNACARDYCESCTKDDLMPFFKCGYEIKNPSAVPDPSIRTTPPLANTTDASLVNPVIDETVVDLINCPAVYPRNDTECVMIKGFEFKKCMYYDVGTDVKCDCNEDRPIWNCTGTITNTEYMNITEVSGATNEEVTEAAIQPLPSVNIVASRIEVVASEVGGL